MISLNGCEKKIIKVPSETVNRFENTVSVIEIRSDAFRNNKNLTDIILGHDIEQIGGGAFEGCTSLERITIPRKINCIWQGTFKDCISLSDIYYEGTPEEWEKIEKFTEKKEVELGKLIPGSPVQKVFEKITPIEGNEALIRATVHFNCDLF
ncbi:MAG: leucine-rich repeat protein [Ruminococcus sp.]|nr:leucine-rich repeat protein [Ruminococcus sp.]